MIKNGNQKRRRKLTDITNELFEIGEKLEKNNSSVLCNFNFFNVCSKTFKTCDKMEEDCPLVKIDEIKIEDTKDEKNEILSSRIIEIKAVDSHNGRFSIKFLHFFSDPSLPLSERYKDISIKDIKRNFDEEDPIFELIEELENLTLNLDNDRLIVWIMHKSDKK